MTNFWQWFPKPGCQAQLEGLAGSQGLKMKIMENQAVRADLSCTQSVPGKVLTGSASPSAAPRRLWGLHDRSVSKKQRTARHYYLSIHCLNLFQDQKELIDIRAGGRTHGNLLVPGEPAAAALWGRAVANAFLSLSLTTFPSFSSYYISQVFYFSGILFVRYYIFSDVIFSRYYIFQIWYY